MKRKKKEKLELDASAPKYIKDEKGNIYELAWIQIDGLISTPYYKLMKF